MAMRSIFVPKALIPSIFPVSNDYPFQSFVATWVHTFSPPLVNKFRPGFSRTVYDAGIPSDPSGVFGLNGNAKTGIAFPHQAYPGFSEVSLGSFESNLGTRAGVKATLHHQTASGTEFTVNYTWSRAMTDNAGFYGVAGVNDFSSFVQDIHNPKRDYGPTEQDSRNVLNATAVWQLPFGRGRRFGANVNRLTDEALGGWQLSGDAVLYSGFPIVMNSNENYNVNSYNAHAIQFQKMRIVHRTTRNWFGTDPTAVPCLAFDKNGNTINNGVCPYGQESETGFGNAQNGSERAPGFRQIDLSASKTFQIAGSQTLLFRGDAFNAFNLASYSSPDNNLVDAAVGRLGLITSTLSSPRILQVAMHYMF